MNDVKPTETIHLSKWWLRLTPEWIPLMIKQDFLKHIQECYFKAGTEKAAEFEWFLDCPVLARVKNTKENIDILRIAFTEFYGRRTLLPMTQLEHYLSEMRDSTIAFLIDFIPKIAPNAPISELINQKHKEIQSN